MAVILITRPEPGASQTAMHVAALGLTPLVAPLVSIRTVGDVAKPPVRIQATVLTSRNAVAGCPAKCRDLVAFAVGEATAACAATAGFKHIEVAGGDAADLAALVTRTLISQDGSLFLPCGRRQGGGLARSLREKGFRVIRRVAYEAVAVSTLPAAADSHLRDRLVRTAMFFSGETAQHFVRLVRGARLDDSVKDMDAVAISERSSVALRELAWRRISVALKPNQDAMLALLQ